MAIIRKLVDGDSSTRVHFLASEDAFNKSKAIRYLIRRNETTVPSRVAEVSSSATLLSPSPGVSCRGIRITSAAWMCAMQPSQTPLRWSSTHSDDAVMAATFKEVTPAVKML
jgi:hypothetical protein